MFNVKLNIMPRGKFTSSEKQERKRTRWGFNGVVRVYSFGSFACENTLRRFPERSTCSSDRILSYRCRKLGILTRTPSP